MSLNRAIQYKMTQPNENIGRSLVDNPEQPSGDRPDMVVSMAPCDKSPETRTHDILDTGKTCSSSATPSKSVTKENVVNVFRCHPNDILGGLKDLLKGVIRPDVTSDDCQKLLESARKEYGRYRDYLNCSKCSKKLHRFENNHKGW